MALDFLKECATILALALVMFAIWVLSPEVHRVFIGG